jgi:hypothetical protein
MIIKQNIKFFDIDSENGNLQEFYYHPAISGKIELKKVSEKLTILKLYFRKLNALNNPINVFEGSTELMLTNYPVNFTTFDDLNNQTIEIKNGWSNGALFTMLSLQDGEPTNDNVIKFQLNSDKSITVKWTGTYTYYHHSNGSKFELNIIAFPEDDIITPLCSYEDELEKLFNIGALK